jgi:hypothetical protein
MQIAQTNQNEIKKQKPCIGQERGRSSVAGMVMKTWCTIAALVAVLPLGAIAHQVSGPKFLANGDLTISYAGIPGRNYVAERADSLTTPATWTPLRTNTADSYGLVIFTNTPAGSQRFYRVRYGSAPPPFVYDVENTGRNCAPPPLPTLGNLPFVEALPDPFMWADSSGRSTNFEDWKCRRAEIQAQIENYEIGPKPEVPSTNITATYAAGVLTVVVTRTNNRALTLTCQVAVPTNGSGPFPAIIGMALVPGGGTGSLPSDIFSNCLQITYLHNQVTEYAAGQQISHTNDPYFLMYPEYTYAGQYSAWAWGVSRVIDGLYMVTNGLRIDLKHIAVTGCSYAGKMALFAGAMDERVALTVAQESGGGGATSWRYSQTLAGVENLGSTDHSWFMQSMFQFSGNNVYYLPEDHHELCAMCAPRALYVTGNPDYQWLANPSCYVCGRAAAEAYKTLGIPERFGFSIVGGHSHCAFPDSQRPELQYFVDKFLFDKTNANQNITTRPTEYDSIDYPAWYSWWGTTNPPVIPMSTNAYTLTFEPECATVGTNWLILSDTNCSNGKYVTITPGLNSTSSAPTNSYGDWVIIPFSVTNSENYSIYGRCNNPTANDDSFWIQMDNGGFTMVNGLGTTGWQWVSIGSYYLTAGPHTLNIAYREDGATLDKVSISDYQFAPSGLGANAAILCP